MDRKCNQSFDSVTERLTTAPVLAFPDLNTPHVISTDASGLLLVTFCHSWMTRKMKEKLHMVVEF